MLFVGCRRYTQFYDRYFADAGTEYWTTDIDPESRRWGVKNRHVVCDIRHADAHFPAGHFDAVLLNGVFGFGVDDVAGMNETIVAPVRMTKPSGVLMIGWNDDLLDDPLELESVMTHFSHGCRLPIDKRT